MPLKILKLNSQRVFLSRFCTVLQPRLLFVVGIKKFLRVGALGVTSSLLLTGCIVIEGPPIEQPSRPAPTIEVTNPEFLASGTAEDNLDFFTYTLLNFVDSEEPITSDNMITAIATAGFSKNAMQHTQDKTKTDLEAESVTVSVLIEEDCLLGQIARKKRELFVNLAPAVGPDKNICLIGGISVQ